MAGRTSFVVLAGVLAMSCTSRSGQRSDEPSGDGVATAVARLRAVPVLGERLSVASDLVPIWGGHTQAHPGAITTIVPSTARATLRVARDEGRYLEIVAEHEADAPGRLSQGAMVYADASRDVDAFVVAERDRVEEIRVLRSERAPANAVWRVRLGAGLASLRLRGDFVEALDEGGRAWLRSDPIFAVDARGARRVPRLTLARDGVAWRLEATLDRAGLAYPIALDPGWGPTGAMSTPRARHAGVKLPSGKILVAGGQSELTSVGVVSTAELYDPTTGTWTSAASMSVPRSWHALVLRADGKAMALGGITTGSCVDLDSTEIYDPASDSWSSGPVMPKKWYLGHAYAFTGNKIAILTGRSCTAGYNNAALLDVASGTWTTSVNAMANERIFSASSRLADGRVLLTGGKLASFGNMYSTADLYDAASNRFTATSTMSVVRLFHQQHTLPSGKVLVTGGSESDGGSGAYHTTAELYDPGTGAWSAAAPLSFKHFRHGGAVLSTGKVLAVSGGQPYVSPEVVDAELYDPVANAWSSAGKLAASRAGALVFDIGGGGAVAIGGDVQNPSPGSGARVVTATVDLLADGVVAGGKCTSNGQCASGFCAAGACCNEACTGKCQSCTEAGSVGTCKSLAAPPPGKGVCDPYVCGAVDCKAVCATSSDCIATHYCDATSKCAPRVDKGAACTTAAQCKTGFCADGFCCDVACGGACEACDQSGSLGTCVKLDGVADKHAKCPTGECTTACVAGACGFAPASKACGGGASTCSGSTFTAAGKCSGTDERCLPGGAAPCPGDLVCADATTCKTKCSGDADCVVGRCDLASGTCGAGSDAGVDTGVADTGAAGVADGGTRIPEDPKVGAEFTRCTKASDCPSGFCVEGVCCDSACESKCHSCALITSPGKCTMSPIGVDLRNDCGPALQCLGTCDGAGQCIGAGNGTMCARNRCTTQSGGVGPAYCPGPGGKCALDAVVAFDCSPYVCEPAFGACRTGCGSSLDCKNGFVCDLGSKTCVAPPPPEDDGGCTTTPGRAGGSAALMVVLLGLVGRRARAARTRLR